MLDMDLLCPVVTRKTLTKLKTISRELSSYGALNVFMQFDTSENQVKFK